MTREEFIKALNRREYSYEIEGNKIVVTHKGDVFLNPLTSIPPDVEFRNGGSVYLNSLTSIPSGVEFRNGRGVNLEFLIGGWFYEWEGNIKGIDQKRLLNKMVADGLLDRR